MSALTVPPIPYTINTIKELADFPLPVSSFADNIYKQAKQSLDVNLQKIAEDLIVHYDFDQAIANASSSKVVMSESRRFLDYIIRLVVKIQSVHDDDCRYYSLKNVKDSGLFRFSLKA